MSGWVRDMSDVTRSDSLYGRRLGDFVLRQRIGEGGGGAVYRSDQPLLGREAVVKVLHKRRRAHGAALQRFAREALFASRLDHPYAAHVYGCGVEDDGLLWIAMEMVHGVTLRERLRTHGPMPLDQFVPFFERVAGVVQAAHELGIVHRDLKPDNVMVIERAGELLPKLLDFGVAKLLGGGDPVVDAEADDDEDPESIDSDSTCVDQRALTSASNAIGSPAYMAPEQWEDPLAVGPAADLYALGVLAYEALTGHRPFRGETHDELRELHRAGWIPPVGPELPPELDRVFTRALAQHPKDRYRCARDLAGALQAVADGRFVAQLRASARQWHDRGRPAGLLWRGDVLADLERWVLRTGGTPRNAALTAAEMAFIEASLDAALTEGEARARRAAWVRRGGIAAAMAMVGIVVGVVQFRAFYETRLAQQRAEDAEHEARATVITAEVEQGRAALLHDDPVEAQQHLDQAWRRGDHSPATAFMLARALQPLLAERARLPAAAGRMWSSSFSPDGAQIVTTDDRGAQVWDATTYAPLSSLPHGDIVYAATWSGARLITACGDGAVRIWNPATGDLVRELRLRGRAPRWRFAAARGRVVAAVDTMGASVAAWDAETGAVLTEFALDGSEWPSIAISADARWLAAGGGDRVIVVDTASWRDATTIPGPRIRTIAWDPTGPRLVTGSTVGDASIWTVPGGRRAAHLREIGEPADLTAWSHDGALVAVAARDGAMQVFDVAAGRIASQGNALHSKVMAVEFAPDDRALVAAGASGNVAVTDARTGMPIAVLDGPTGAIRTVRFAPDGRRAIAASWDGTARVWDAGDPYRRWVSPAAADVSCGQIGGVEPDGPVLAIACPGRPTRVWDAEHGALLAELPPMVPGPVVPFPAIRGDRVAIARGDTAELYALHGGRLLVAAKHSTAVTAVAIGAGGEPISGDAAGAVRAGDVVLRAEGEPVDAIAVLADGRIAVAAGRRVEVLPGGPAVEVEIRAAMLRPSPDGGRLLVVPSYFGAGGQPVLVDLQRGAVIARLAAPRIYTARWVPGGFLTAHADGTARIWGADGSPGQIYRGAAAGLVDADLSPDGSAIVGAGGDGVLRFWDVVTGRALWAVQAHQGMAIGVWAGPGVVVTRGTGGEVSRWHLPEPASVIGAGKIRNAGL